VAWTSELALSGVGKADRDSAGAIAATASPGAITIGTETGTGVGGGAAVAGSLDGVEAIVGSLSAVHRGNTDRVCALSASPGFAVPPASWSPIGNLNARPRATTTNTPIPL